ncbi:MAG: pyridoxal phosphate-dependent aminotransferase [Aestuariivita sp.]|nr:pyridoxal phosphate-dependent aminotransferase [Aestuariivita sp.]MCY4203175.1 pyridoxal phosphate-dependent aminotransferase [Aestuariivita sp.]MCY4287766.1 pyridoxal phosphate-dependent aminotransferase [Aestuariivita sp.]MCY4345725.1 pyridoxal phosphate-dependent aminotransferase [Aestuariivita sp.]
MAILSNRIRKVAASQTSQMTDIARKMQAAGRDIISLAAGEPDFDTPKSIRDAAITAIEAGKTRYTAVDGISELKDAIIAKFARDNQLHYTHEEISVATGGKQILFNALMATINPGDEVIIPSPYWVSYPEMIRIAGGIPKTVNTESNGFKITPEDLNDAIGENTKWVIMNSPANPTGAVYSWYELRRLTEVLLEHPHVWVLTDDIYEPIIYDDVEFHTVAEVEPLLKQQTLTCNGCSKAYAMTGWRIGYAGGPKELIAAMRKIQSQSTSNPSSISQWAAVAALTGPQEIIQENNQVFQQRRDLIVSMLNTTNLLSCNVPDGAFYAYSSLHKVIGMTTPDGVKIVNDSVFANKLLEDTGVAVVCGAAFGTSPYFRVSFAASQSELEIACTRIQDFCQTLSD